MILENLIVFEECSEFIAFLDYMMYIKPREIFNDIPKGHQGLHACIELCVLTSHFHCKVLFVGELLPQAGKQDII